MSMFAKAQKKRARLRIALIGPAGSGKTRTALELAAGLGTRIAVIDSERDSASLYSDLVPFDGMNLESFSPANYIAAINGAEREGYDVLIIDSLSHAWSGKGGALEMVDKVAKNDTRGNSFNAWREVTPEHNKLVDAMLRCRSHLIVTMRTKTEYVIEENERGKKVPRKIGLAPVQREGLDYEFTVVGDLDINHTLTITKTRCEALDGAVIHKPGREMAATLVDWLEGAAVVPEQPSAATVDQDASSAEAPAVRPPHIAEAAQVAPPAPVSTIVDALGSEVDSLKGAIAAAGTPDALGLLVPRLTALPGKEKGELRAIYSARLADLTPRAAVAGQ